MQHESEILRFQEGQRSQHPAPEATVEYHPPEGVIHAGEVLVVLVDLQPALPHRSRELRAIAIQAYWNSSGSTVARLRRCLAELNRYLIRVNTHSEADGRATGSVTCAVLQGEDLFLGQVGSASALFYDAETGLTESFPRAGRPLIPLGASLPSIIHIGYAALAPGSTLLLATTTLFQAQARERWHEILARADFGDALEAVAEAMAASQASGSAVLLRCRPDAVETEPSEPPRRRWPFGRHESAQSPVIASEPVPQIEVPPTPVVAPISRLTPPAFGEPLVPATLVPRPRSGTGPLPPLAGAPATPAPVPARSPAPPPEFEAPDEDATLEVEPGTDSAPRWRLSLPALHWPHIQLPHLERKTPQKPWRIGQLPFRQMFKALLPGPVQTRGVGVQRNPPEEKATIMGGLTLGFMLLVIFITLVTYLEFGGAESPEQTLTAAQEARAAAYNEQTVDAWEEVRSLAEESVRLDPANAEALQLRDEAEQAIAALESAALLELHPIADLGMVPAPRHLLVAGGWVYWLNTATDEVSGIQLTEDRLAALSSAPISILKRGQTFYGEAVEHLVDLAWVQSPASYPDGAVFIYCDAGELYIYEPSLGPQSIDRQRLSGDLTPGSVMLMDVWGEQVFLVDRQRNQVWSYWPVNGLYDSPPRPYFAPSAVPPLQNVLDTAIDGRVYLLTGDGALHAYFEGTEDLSFSIQGVPDLEFSPTVLAVDQAPEDGHIYLGDPRRERIVVLDKQGRFLHQFRLSNQMLEHLEALAISRSVTNGILYFIADNRLYAAPLPDFAQ